MSTEACARTATAGRTCMATAKPTVRCATPTPSRLVASTVTRAWPATSAVHKGKLDCAACHVVATTACMNCHMDTFLATGSRKGTFFPIQDWLLLINHEGKVTSATAMTIVYQDKKFICYGPYFTHAVQPKGKQCGDCHGNEAVKMIKDGQRVPMMTYKDGNVVAWKGVVPVVADQLDWTYLNKVGDTWVPVEGNGKETVQYVEYGTPLTEEQIKKMAMPFEQ
jgi:hypothetical protein